MEIERENEKLREANEAQKEYSKKLYLIVSKAQQDSNNEYQQKLQAKQREWQQQHGQSLAERERRRLETEAMQEQTEAVEYALREQRKALEQYYNEALEYTAGEQRRILEQQHGSELREAQAAHVAHEAVEVAKAEARVRQHFEQRLGALRECVRQLDGEGLLSTSPWSGEGGNPFLKFERP